MKKVLGSCGDTQELILKAHALNPKIKCHEGLTPLMLAAFQAGGSVLKKVLRQEETQEKASEVGRPR